MSGAILLLLERSRRIESWVFPSSMFVCYLKYLPRIVPWQVSTSPPLSRLAVEPLALVCFAVLELDEREFRMTGVLTV